ncbi:hypothetical protein BGZ73_002082, partial [Actinomortierella ambigua]
VAHDTLQQSWTRWRRPFICPPWNLIPRILSKIRPERVSATIITPNWTSDLVPSSADDDDEAPDHPPTRGRSPTLRKRYRDPEQEHLMAPASLVHRKRPRLQELGYSTDAIQLLAESPSALS